MQHLNTKETRTLHNKQNYKSFINGLFEKEIHSINLLNEDPIKHKFNIYKDLVYLIEYGEKYLARMRYYYKISNEDILNSLDRGLNRLNIFNICEGEGSSGSFFFFSYDKKFIIKTLTKEELRLFMSFIGEYTKHLTSSHGSIIVKIFGVFTLKMRNLAPIYLILMENSLPKDNTFVICYSKLYLVLETCF